MRMLPVQLADVVERFTVSWGVWMEQVPMVFRVGQISWETMIRDLFPADSTRFGPVCVLGCHSVGSLRPVTIP